MSKRVAIAAGSLMAGIGIVGLVAANDGTYIAGYADTDCTYWHGGYVCDGSPVASPIPVVTNTPVATVEPTPGLTPRDVVDEPTSEIDTVDTLPGTGTGSTYDR